MRVCRRSQLIQCPLVGLTEVNTCWDWIPLTDSGLMRRDSGLAVDFDRYSEVSRFVQNCFYTFFYRLHQRHHAVLPIRRWEIWWTRTQAMNGCARAINEGKSAGKISCPRKPRLVFSRCSLVCIKPAWCMSPRVVGSLASAIGRQVIHLFGFVIQVSTR